jgi:hypothetical protein
MSIGSGGRVGGGYLVGRTSATIEISLGSREASNAVLEIEMMMQTG